MISAPAGISEADWQATPTAVRAFILNQQAELRAQQQEIEQLRGQLAGLATELASLREQIGRSSRNSSKPVTFRKDVAGWRLFRPPAARVTPPVQMWDRAVH